MTKPAYPGTTIKNTIGAREKGIQTVLNTNTFANNVHSLTSSYNTTPSGYFGKKGASSKNGNRVIKSRHHFKDAVSFWNKISQGSKISNLPGVNGKLAKFPDGTTVTFRKKTSTKHSPAIEIIVRSYSPNIRTQKIHFIGGSNNGKRNA
jgi:hypothetical protein